MTHSPCIRIGEALSCAVAVLLCLTDSGGLRAEDVPAKAPTEFTLNIQRSVLSHTFVGQGGIRYFVSEIAVTNRSAMDLTVPVIDMRLLVDGKEYTPEFSPRVLKGYDFQVDDESIRFRDLQQEQELKLKPGETQSTWIVFTKLPTLSPVPHMVLRVSARGQVEQIDVNQHHALRLQLSQRLIGPGKSLGLIRIGGTLDTVNVGTLTAVTDELAGRNVSRIIVSFTEIAGPVTGHLGGWIQQLAEDNGTARQYSQFPAIASSIRELHVVALPGHSASTSSQRHSRPFLHQSEALAVEWALLPVFQNLSSSQIAEEIQHGDRLVRAAALATGAGRLSDDNLPMIVKLTASDDRVLQRAAFLALREFGQPHAIAQLTRHARSKDASLATLAVECLAASRFEVAHRALAELLEGDLSVTPADLSRILAKYPRERWLETLTRFASGSSPTGQLSIEDEANVRRDALQALGRIGHPQLVDLLAKALEADDALVRSTAFSLLIAQQDEWSNQLALDSAIARIETDFPSPQILTLLERVPDSRAVPLLVNHLETAQKDRSKLIKTLARIGGAGIDRTLAEQFSSLEAREQAAVLSELTQLQSNQAVPLAAQAIQSEENVLFNAAVGVLQLQESSEAVQILMQALVDTTKSQNVRALTRALSEIGTTDAINALRQARALEKDDDKLRRIVQSLQTIEARSPGLHALNQAKQHAYNEDWDKALEDYDVALKIDPELTAAYSGRGHSRLQLERLEEAGEDYREALARNPFDGLSVTGLSIVLVRQGDTKGGIKLIQDAVDRFSDDALFAYNSACVYGRALEAALAQDPSPEREQSIQELQSEAIKQLKLSTKRGFQDFDFMRRDPDLAPLRELPEFQNIKARDGEDIES